MAGKFESRISYLESAVSDLSSTVAGMLSRQDEQHRQNQARLAKIEQDTNRFSPEQVQVLQSIGSIGGGAQWIGKKLAALLVFLSSAAVILEGWRAFFG